MQYMHNIHSDTHIKRKHTKRYLPQLTCIISVMENVQAMPSNYTTLISSVPSRGIIYPQF